MKVIKTYKYSRLVWLKKGEDFPGTVGLAGKQGFYILWTGSNLSDFRSSEYLGPTHPDAEYLEQRLNV